MTGYEAAQVLKALLTDARITKGLPLVEIYTSFERDFLEGLCRIGAASKLENLNAAQSGVLVGIYYKYALLPHIVTPTYKRSDRNTETQEATSTPQPKKGQDR